VIDSLKDYLSFAETKGWVLEIAEAVDREDIPRLIERLDSKKKIILFSDIRGYHCGLVANLVPSHDVFCHLLETDDPYRAFSERSKRLESRVLVDEGTLEKIDMEGKELLEFLPLLKHYEGDSAPFITTSIVSCEDPRSGIVGRGIHRMEYRGGNRLGVTLLSPPLKDIHEWYQSKNEFMPIVVTLGVDPVGFLSMALKASGPVDKLDITGGLKGKGTGVFRLGGEVEVPAGADIYLKGYVDESIRRQDGPLGEISGYYMTIPETPTVVVKEIYFRPSPVYHALLPTSLEANMYLTFVSRAHIEENLKKLYPSVSDITFVEKTFGASLIVRVKPGSSEKIKNLIIFLLSFPMIKKVVVVDLDVDPDDLKDVEWACITRCSADRDMVIIQGLQGQTIDPQAGPGYRVTKIGIDATAEGKTPEGRAVVTAGNRDRIERIMEAVGGVDE
jgi:2,5-furandicarboxylate decarboxylase 1